jgi:ABC-type branched-subunit amino acid transport system ATPase component
VGAVHPPLLIDSYPPKVRMRVLSFYQGATSVGSIVAPLLVALLTGPLLFTWRGTFLVMGFVSIAAAIIASRLRDPGFGRWDTARAREAVREERGYDDAPAESDVSLGFFEIVRRLFLIPTVRRLLAAFAVFGMLLVPLNTYLFFFLNEHWGMGPSARGLFLAGMAAFGIIGLAVSAKRADALFSSDLSNLPKIGAWILVASIVALAVALFVPVFGLMVAFFGLAFLLFAVLNPIITAAMLSIIPAQMRPHAAALSGIFLAGVGGFGGILLLGGVDRRFGVTGAIASIAIPGVLAAVVLYSAHRTIDADLDRMVDELVEEEEVRGIVASGAHLPLLACRNLDFAYGQVQVLFRVNFTVDDGEMVALLGTNGAGKSTLLRAISGLGLPIGGSVRLRGTDITYVDPERRLKLGITQIPGGRAVFGPLTVVDNLRLFGFTHGRDRATLDACIDTCFEVFPALAERRNNLASTLSGGEQQMLGLARTFILEPRLLLIDELSLGLAPVIVAQLLEMVRRINAGGTAVVLVEQSVNVALSLVDHAYFMEKGEIRFDGSASDLLTRADLLRSVFLEGARSGIKR